MAREPAHAAAVHGGRARARGAGERAHAAGAQPARGAARPPAAPPPQGGARDLPAEIAVRGLRGGRLERLDRGAARLRGVLLPGGLPVPARGPPERHEPRDRADSGELSEPGGGAEGVLRSDAVNIHLHALLG